MKRRYWIFSLVVVAVLTGLWLLWPQRSVQNPQVAAGQPKTERHPGFPAPPAETGRAGAKITVQPEPVSISQAELDAAAAVVEKQKEIDKTHMKKLRDGIFAYRAKYGHYPEYLSQLAPEFVSADTLVSPRKKNQRGDGILASDHPDPGIQEPSYGYEFSNLEFRDGRTFAEIKEVQRSEWGDVVPLLRFFGYDKVINLSWGGEIFETQLNWEWDAATLDVVDKLGWGPGLNEGEMVKVKVVGPDGAPLTGAKVWADGRNYSFDLPERPFTTDAEGYAKIPVGVDLDRTALSLRVQADGYTAPVKRFEVGTVPESATLTTETASQNVGGIVVDEHGTPLADTRIVLRDSSGGSRSGANLTQTRTDSQGRWQATINPADATAFDIQAGIPGGQPMRFGGSPVDAAAAAAGKAVLVVPGGK